MHHILLIYKLYKRYR